MQVIGLPGSFIRNGGRRRAFSERSLHIAKGREGTTPSRQG
jgi:hypothetical protein